MKKRILLLTSCIETFTHGYVSRVLIPAGFATTIIAFTCEDDIKYYRRNKVRIILLGTSESGQRLRFFRHLLVVHRVITKEMKHFEFVHFHQANCGLFRWARFFLKHSNKIEVSFWGSDLLRADKKTLRAYKPILDKANKITVITEEMKNVLSERYRGTYDRKTNVIDFGVAAFDNKEEFIDNKKVQSKAIWGVPDGKLSIHIGYNGNEAQQHIPMIRALFDLPENIKEKVHLTVHAGYGSGSTEYIDSVRRALKESRMSFSVLDDYYDQEKVMSLRLSADVFLYGQMTDALSASLLEYIYSGAKIVKGRWLQYSLLERNNLVDYEYNHFKEIPGIVMAIQGDSALAVDVVNDRRRKLREMNSWEALTPKWVELYQ